MKCDLTWNATCQSTGKGCEIASETTWPPEVEKKKSSLAISFVLARVSTASDTHSPFPNSQTGLDIDAFATYLALLAPEELYKHFDFLS